MSASVKLARSVAALPLRLPSKLDRRNLRFPLFRREVRRLRELRERLLGEGRITPAIRVAETLARVVRDPESYLRWGVALREGGRLREAIRAFHHALRFDAVPDRIQGQAHLQAAYTWMRLGNGRRMSQAMRRALEHHVPASSEGAFQHQLGNSYYSKGDYVRAGRAYEAAEALYVSARDRGLAALNLGLTLEKLGRTGEAERHFRRATEILKKSGDPAALARARQFLSKIYFDQGRFRLAFSMLLRSAGALRRTGNVMLEVEALYNAGYAAGEAGLWKSSRILQDRAVALAARTGQWKEAACAHACRATANGFLGDFDAARSDLAKARALLRGRRHPFGTLHLLRAEARIARLLEDWGGLRAWARRAEQLAAKLGDGPRVIEYRRMRAEAEERLGHERPAVLARRSATRLEAARVRGRDGGWAMEQALRRLAATGLRLLITGESGTGKSELAGRLHSLSPQSKGPLVRVPCELLVFPEAELAGALKGAWSGAAREVKGYARLARGGTLLLDRVDELPQRAQRVLLRIVEGWIRPVGGTVEERVDFRVVATCRREEALIPSLRARLSGAVLRLPPLREKQDALPALIQGWLAGRRQVSPDAVAALVRRRWEGNLPELRNVVEQLVTASRKRIGLRHLRPLLKPLRDGGHAVRVRRSTQAALAAL